MIRENSLWDGRGRGQKNTFVEALASMNVSSQ